MRNIKSASVLSSILVLGLLPILFFSCTEDDDIRPDSLVWQPSAISPDFIFYVDRLSKSDDGKLYAFGTTQKGIQILSWANNTWSEVATPSLNENNAIYNVNDLQFYNGRIFISSIKGLYQIDDSEVQLIREIDFSNTNMSQEYFSDMEVFQGKLLIQGRLTIDQTLSTIFTYNGTAFSSVTDRYYPALLRDNDDLFIQLENDLYQYNQGNLSLIKEQPNTIRVHNNEWYALKYNNSTRQIVKSNASGKEIVLGDSFPSNIGISKICFLGDIPVAIGINYDTQLSVTYLFQKSKWDSIPTIVQLSNVTEFNGRILATSYNNSGIIELSSN